MSVMLADSTFRHLLEAVPDASVIVNSHGIIQQLNEAAEQLFGYQRTELMGKSVDLLVPDNIQTKHVNHREGFSASPKRRSMGAGLELYAKRQDNTLIPVDISLSPLRIGNEVLTIASIRDITDRRHDQQEIHKLNSELNKLFLLSNDLMAIASTDGYFKRINPAWEKVLGYKDNELLKNPYIDFIHPDDVERTIAEAGKLAEGDHITVAFENRYRHSDGSYRWIQWNSSPAGETIFAVARDVTRQKQLEAEYRQAKIDAEQANHAKSEFLSRMSHELRTPLNAVLGFAQLLQLEELSVQQRENIEQIIKGGKHLLQLINEVLDIARIEGGRLQLSPEPINVREAIDEARELMKPLADQRNASLELKHPESWDQYLLADKQRLKQVFLNLISNAVKYGYEGQVVALTCERKSQDRLRISITDSGPGIPQGKIDGLFTPFNRLDTNAPGVEGTGLGLALSKRLIEAMNGKLGLDSVVDKGSTFWVELPITQNPLSESEQIASALPSHHSNTTHKQHKRRVLYIEDNLSNLKLIEQILAMRPEIQMLSIMQGRLGLQMAREHQPHLILLDLHLPDIPGEEILVQLQTEHRTRDIPVIIISADATPNQVRRLMAAGAHGYLTKPLDVKKFLTLIDRMLYQEA